MTEREKIVKDLTEVALNRHHSTKYIDAIADFIIADRKRIVEPLVKLINPNDEFKWHVTRTSKAIRETLRNAGIE